MSEKNEPTKKTAAAIETKAADARAEALKIADELATLKVQIKGIDHEQSNALDALGARVRLLASP